MSLLAKQRPPLPIEMENSPGLVRTAPQVRSVKKRCSFKTCSTWAGLSFLMGFFWLFSGPDAPTFPPPDAAAVDSSTVTLAGYGSFSGRTVSETLTGRPLPGGGGFVDAWLGMDYATQPVEGAAGRFQPVDWPASFTGVRAATAWGPICPQDPRHAPGHLAHQSEACLNFNVFRTPGVPLSHRLPVLVWIHGGSFYMGSHHSLDAAAFVAASTQPVVVVTFHYRLNSLGSLPSALFARAGLLNLGLRDQHLMLRFVRRHISAFGGDPDQITLGGRSAGGHAVGIHYFHNYGDEADREPLFARAIHQSGSVTARTFPNATYPLYQTQFAEYMKNVGCDSADDDDAALACLRAAPLDVVRGASIAIFEKYEDNLTWPFQPTQGGPLFEKPGSKSGLDGTFFHVPTISSSVTDEARIYLGGGMETDAEFVSFMRTSSPGLTHADVDKLRALYPDPATDKSSPYAAPPHGNGQPRNGTQYTRLSAAWSDYGYICPSQETAYRAASAGVPTWKLRFDTPNHSPAWQGVPHASDTKYTWAEPTVSHPEVGPLYHAYLASFVTAGDPNTHRLPGSPAWPRYEPAGYGLDAAPSHQLLVRPDAKGGTVVEKDDIRREACLYWRDPERAPRLNK